jgi:2-dehydro-3-deoxyphosphogluconate aldolase/(4S)-4-hydroxy-2-oxoglutarate aldolase
MKRYQIIALMEKSRVVPVFYHPDLEVCKEVLKACYKGGIRIFEFTNRGERAHELFRELRIFAQHECPDMCLGAGTVLEPGTASLFMQLGAAFIVSPVLSQEIIKTCNRRKVLHIPGCATLTEISQAEEWGADIVKVFPGDVLKPAFVKALKGPMPWSNVMVTGGVAPTPESVKEWLAAGVSCVGMGSQLFKQELMQSKDYEGLSRSIASLMQALA